MTSEVSRNSTITAFAEHWFEHRVSYGETDCMGVVYYAEYFHIYERSRSAYIRSLGMPYTEVEAKGVFLPVREAKCRYKVSAKYDDILMIHISISELSRASISFSYKVYDKHREKLMAEGMTQHACVNNKGVPIRMPEWFRQLVEKKLQ